MSPRRTVDQTQGIRPVSADITELADRLALVERRQRQLKRALDAVAREAGVSIGSPCSRCQQSYLLVRRGQLSCPACGYQESL